MKASRVNTFLTLLVLITLYILIIATLPTAIAYNQGRHFFNYPRQVLSQAKQYKRHKQTVRSTDLNKPPDQHTIATTNELDDDDINPDFYTSPQYNLLEQQFLLQQQQDQLELWRKEILRRWLVNRARQFDRAYRYESGMDEDGYYEDRRAFVASAEAEADDREASSAEIAEGSEDKSNNEFEGKSAFFQASDSVLAA